MCVCFFTLPVLVTVIFLKRITQYKHVNVLILQLHAIDILDYFISLLAY